MSPLSTSSRPWSAFLLLMGGTLLFAVACRQTPTGDDDTNSSPQVEGDEVGECGDGVDNDEDGDVDCIDSDCLSDHASCPVQESWLTTVAGTSSYTMSYTDGPLESEVCVAQYSASGANITELQTQDCTQCDVVYSLYWAEDEGSSCIGAADGSEEALMGLDLRQDSGEAVLWWFVEGNWGSEDAWYELSTGELVRDDEARTLSFHAEFDDPNNGNDWINGTVDDPCSWGSPCTWDGAYVSDYILSFEPQTAQGL